MQSEQMLQLAQNALEDLKAQNIKNLKNKMCARWVARVLMAANGRCSIWAICWCM